MSPTPFLSLQSVSAVPSVPPKLAVGIPSSDVPQRCHPGTPKIPRGDTGKGQSCCHPLHGPAWPPLALRDPFPAGRGGGPVNPSYLQAQPGGLRCSGGFRAPEEPPGLCLRSEPAPLPALRAGCSGGIHTPIWGPSPFHQGGIIYWGGLFPA